MSPVVLYGRSAYPPNGARLAALVVAGLGDGHDVRFVVHCASQDVTAEAADFLSQYAHCPTEVRPFTADHDELTQAVRSADVVIMPSRGEDFGSVPFDAACEGVPVLVPDDSGIGMFLTDPVFFAAELAGPCLVHHEPGPLPLELWTHRLASVLSDLAAARRRARQISDTIRSMTRTPAGARALTAALSAMNPALEISVQQAPRGAPGGRPPGPAQGGGQ
jgi:glycosyltransferase involved in cell wall biosynthesis